MFFGFTSLTYLYFYVALDMYISELSGTWFSFSFIEVSGNAFWYTFWIHNSYPNILYRFWYSLDLYSGIP